MDYHQNARLTIHGREQLARGVVEQGMTLKLAAATFHVSAKTAAKWAGRYREAGAAWSVRPVVASPSVPTHYVFSFTRKGFGSSPAAPQWLMDRSGAASEPRHRQPHPAQRRHESAAFARLPPVVRYEHKHPGDLIHFDIKRLTASSSPAIVSTATAHARPAAPAMSISTSRSTITAASASPPSCPIRPALRPNSSSTGPALTSRD